MQLLKKTILLKNIYVIDAGLIRDAAPTILKSGAHKPMPSPKFKNNSNEFVYKYFNSMLRIVEKNFFTIGSFAKGGLSNIWGGGLQPYNKQELSEFPYTYNQVKGIYTKVLKILTNTNSILDEHSQSISEGLHSSFYTHEPLLAINSIKGKSYSCDLESCDSGCINCNKNIFNSAYEIDSLVSKSKINYLSGLFIKSIYREDNCYYLNCLDINSGDPLIIKTRIIFSCLGTISTTKIVLGMTKNDKSLPLLSTPGGAFFLFSYKKIFAKTYSILSFRSFSGKDNDTNFNGNIYPVSKNLIEVYFGVFWGRAINFLFWKLLFSRLFIANIYFPSNLSLSTISSNSKGIIINSRTNYALKKIFKSSMKIITRGLLKEGLALLPIGKRLLAPGQDIHYGGTLPMKKEPKDNECNLEGELNGFKNFYIADSSSMPCLPGKGQSFNSMVNSFYITTRALENERS